MLPLSLLFLPLSLAIPLSQLPLSLPPPTTDVYQNGWYDPTPLGGRLLNVRSSTSPHWTSLTFSHAQRAWGDLGEPLNIVISNRSSPDVLRENGFVAYSRSLGLWCVPD